MISVEKFCEPENYAHWDTPNLSGYIYHNVLNPYLFQGIKKEIRNIINSESKSTFLTNTTIIHDNDKKIKIGANYSNDRYQNVLFDLSFHNDYWYQTTDTIATWAYGIIYNTSSPYFIKYIDIMRNVEPFNDPKWLPIRLHLNYLNTNDDLSLHIDGNPLLFKNNLIENKALSLTYYTHNHKPNLGGELFTINGWSFKPQENTAIAMNGNQVLHGVTANQTDEARLAFTMRWVYTDDLFLPGHPDKHLYKMDHL